ncbi:hypothetical protein GCM10010253_64090 [Streptomyces badius]|uniref:Uncharacterized protein n=1 Tax=Streptomyces badius TaxID=1941 RepID=A0ABQ2TNJ0_STRBA|nr:hypothetical protein GCM10010253_64090 [Streptomyces badius]
MTPSPRCRGFLPDRLRGRDGCAPTGLVPSRRVHHWQVLPTYEVVAARNIRNDPITYTYLPRTPSGPRRPTAGRPRSGRPECGYGGRAAYPLHPARWP